MFLISGEIEVWDGNRDLTEFNSASWPKQQHIMRIIKILFIINIFLDSKMHFLPRETTCLLLIHVQRSTGIIFTYCRILAKKKMLLLTDVLLFSPLWNMHLSAFWIERQAKRQVFNILYSFCNSINFFMISLRNTLNPFASPWDIPTGLQSVVVREYWK